MVSEQGSNPKGQPDAACQPGTVAFGLTFTLITDKDPTREHIARYTKTLLLPWLGATDTIRYRMMAVATKQYNRKPAHMLHHVSSKYMLFVVQLLTIQCQVVSADRALDSPGCSAIFQTCKRDVISRSSGAWSTIVMLPTMQSTQPRIPKILSLSFSMMCASTALHGIAIVHLDYMQGHLMVQSPLKTVVSEKLPVRERF